MASKTQQSPLAGPLAEPVPRRGPWFARVTLIVVTVIVLTNLVAALLVAGFQIYHDGLIYPGVSVWGIDLSGLTPQEAAIVLQGQFNYPQNAIITFRDGSHIWPITAGELGVQFDVQRTVQAAYEIGRQPRLLPSLRQQATAWQTGIMISPVIVFDQRAADLYLGQIAQVINRPALDATVSIEGLSAVTMPSQIGRQVDVEATLSALRGMILSLESGEIEVVVIETPPAIANADAAALAINNLLAADLEVYIDNPAPGDPGPWIATRESLAGMLVVDRMVGEDTAEYAVHLDEARLASFLEPLAPDLARDPVDARLIFNEETSQVEPLIPSEDGRVLNVAASVQLINQQAFGLEHRVPLVFDVIAPAVPGTATAEQLGVVELISSATTYYAGSSQARRANIRTAASRFNGVVIPPGTEFSFNQYLGDVSPETGFEEALIIYNGRTITGVGGGVCQVSTTAFQAAFYAGFPILERWPHGYWVRYYDSGEGKGMDATVYSPYVDLRFINDTEHYLLIETDANLTNTTITFRFYGTSDGRTVQKDGPYVTNVVPHGPSLYEENASLAPGTVKQVDYAVDGFDVTLYRTVYRDGRILYQDTFFSQYMPWQAVYQVPPGEVPPGARRVDS
jgi:vancomycin resistance protein YoaR